MTNLIDYTWFVGALSIPNLEKDLEGFNTDYIAPYQKEILIKLLGFDLYLAFEAGLTADTIDQIWIDLRDGSTYQIDEVNYRNPGVKDIITHYVYCKWLSANYQQLTGVGAINTTTDNAVKVDPENKLVYGWNNMLNYYYLTYKFLAEKETDYPNWEFTSLQLMTYGF